MIFQTASRISDVEIGACKLLILDFDGVMTRLDLDWPALKRDLSDLSRREMGIEATFHPLASGREKILHEGGAVALAKIDACLAERELESVSRAILSPEVAGLLSARPSLPAAICSANSRRALEAAVERFGLRGRFAVIVGREDVRRTKPDPEGIILILSRLGCPPGSALFIGDRDVDARAGEAAGVPTVVVPASEAARLQEISRHHSYEEGFNGRLTRYRARAIMDAVPRGGRLLEIGCGGGALAEVLAGHFDSITLVEASPTYLEAARRRLGGLANYHQALAEEFATEERFDCVLASGLLEHVADPVAILRRCRALLAEGGMAVFLVPNARSLHRRIGLHMGLLSRLDELQEQDFEVGHRRYYTRESLRSDIEGAGLRVAHERGVFLKPLANWQMEGWDEALADAFDASGRELPDHCAELMAVCRGGGDR